MNDKAFATAHTDWETCRDAWIAAVAGRDQAQFIAAAAANAEPLCTAVRYRNAAMPAVAHSGILNIPGGATGAEVARLMAVHNKLCNQHQLENNVHQALKHLYVKMVPKVPCSDLIGGEDNDVDLHSIYDLLDHLDKKYNKMFHEERDAIFAIFDSPAGELTPEQCFTRQAMCQTKLVRTPTPITDNRIKDKVIVEFNKKPWMQHHMEAWEEDDPNNTKTVQELRTYIIQKSVRHYENKEHLREAGIFNNVEAAVKTDLAKTRAEVAALRSQLQEVNSNMNSIASAVLSQGKKHVDSDSDLSENGSIPPRVTIPHTNNRVTAQDPIVQQLLNQIAKLEHNKDIFRDSTDDGIGKNRKPGARPKDLTGHTHTVYCPNCGVQLTPGKCLNGCVGIKRGHHNLPFPTQAEADAVTFENRSQFDKASNQCADKWGKEWSTCTDPRIVAQARSSWRCGQSVRDKNTKEQVKNRTHVCERISKTMNLVQRLTKQTMSSYVPSGRSKKKKKKHLELNSTVLHREYSTDDSASIPSDTTVSLDGEWNAAAAPEEFYLTRAFVVPTTRLLC